MASWLVNIPLVKAKLALSDGALGLVLLSTAVGAVVAMPCAGWLIPRVGSSWVTRAAVVTLCVVVTLPILAPTVLMLVLSLFLLGMSRGALGVAMNAQAVAVEDALGKPIMSSFHGWFSLGGLAGAGLGGLLLQVGLTPVQYALSVALLFGSVTLFAVGNLYPSKDEGAGRPTFKLPSGLLLALGVLTFLVMMSEGAVADWSAVYLSDTLGTSASFAATGFAAFSLTMAAGRFLGDALVKSFGPVFLVRVSASLAAVGLGAGLLLDHPLAMLVGFGCAGFGIANLVPLLFGAAARVPGVSSSAGLAAVSSVGYLGFLVGPPLIGLSAEIITLRGSLLVVAALVAVIAVFAHVLKR